MHPYSAVDHHDTKPRTAAVEYARTLDLHHQERLYICAARVQIVAGTNYEIEVSTEKSCDGPRDVVKLFESLDGEFEITTVSKNVHGATQ